MKKSLLLLLILISLPLAAAECMLDGEVVPCSELTGFFWGMGVFIFLFVLTMLAGLVFWIIMLVDCAKRNFKKSEDKLIWILIVVLLQVIGAVVYYFVVKRKNRDVKN